MDSEQRLIDIELRLAHQDQAIQDLSGEMYRQQQQIALLEDRCRQLLERIAGLGGAAPSGDASDEVPPHY